MRAQKRQQFQIDELEKENRNAPYYEKRKHGLFNDRTKTSAWDTEYRRNYAAYNGQEYEKVLSSRLHPRKHFSASFIPA